MKRRLRAYKKTVSIVNEKAIELYKGLGIEKKGFLLEGTDKESGQYTFMGVEPNEIIQSDKDSLVITRKDGVCEVPGGCGAARKVVTGRTGLRPAGKRADCGGMAF